MSLFHADAAMHADVKSANNRLVLTFIGNSCGVPPEYKFSKADIEKYSYLPFPEIIRSLEDLVSLGCLTRYSVSGEMITVGIIDDGSSALVCKHGALSVRRKPISRRKRDAVIKKYGMKCHYCGTELTEETLTLDHVIPLAKGGSNDIENLVPACRSCNCKKGTKPAGSMR